MKRYQAAIAADPGNAACLLELDKLFDKMDRPSAERLAFLESHLASVEKSDPTVLRLAYLYNETGQYDKSLAILTTRRFHVWEGAAALHQPFVDACLLRGLSKLASGKSAEALRDFQLADTYPENLQAGRPGNAGQGPRIYYYAAMAHRAMGNAKQAEAALRKALEGRVADGEMNYYRLLACRELGDESGRVEQRRLLKGAIAALEQPEVIDAYAKFGGENTPKERVGHRSAEAAYLKGLLALADGGVNDAKRWFGIALKERSALIWAKYFLESIDHRRSDDDRRNSEVASPP